MPRIPGPAAASEPSAALDSAAEASAVNEVKLRAAVKWYKPFGGNKLLLRDRDKDYNLKALARASVRLYVRAGGGEGGGGLARADREGRCAACRGWWEARHLAGAESSQG